MRAFWTLLHLHFINFSRNSDKHNLIICEEPSITFQFPPFFSTHRTCFLWLESMIVRLNFLRQNYKITLKDCCFCVSFANITLCSEKERFLKQTIVPNAKKLHLPLFRISINWQGMEFCPTILRLKISENGVVAINTCKQQSIFIEEQDN